MLKDFSMRQYVEDNKGLVLDIGKSFITDLKGARITVSSGHLAYVSLLSLVPVIMVFFMIMSAFPAFSEIREVFEDFIFQNFVPTAGDVVQEHIGSFVANASGMGAVGIASLLVVALLLISNIDKAFNHLWQTQVQRPFVYTFAIYWMVITLGPLLIGSSIAVSSYLAALAAFADDYTPGFGTAFLKMVPSLAAIGAFLILYMVVPNRPVKARYALGGAILAAVLFEVTKKAFSLYISSVTSYQVIYGALATIPITIFWIYLTWLVVMIGAVFTFSITTTCEKWEKEQEKADDSQNEDVEKPSTGSTAPTLVSSSDKDNRISENSSTDEELDNNGEYKINSAKADN